MRHLLHAGVRTAVCMDGLFSLILCSVYPFLTLPLPAGRGGYGACEHPCGGGYSQQFPRLSVDLSRRMSVAVRAPHSSFPYTHTYAEDRVEL